MARPTKRRATLSQDDDGSSPEPPAQRRRTTPSDEEDNEDGQAPDSHNDVEDASYGDEGGNSDASIDQMVKKLVRLALACEYQRRPIRRADISEKVLAGDQGGRKFKDVFAQAQIELKGIFGMEMVELPAKEKVTVAQKRAAAKKSYPAAASTTSWILRSILPSQFRDPAIITNPAAPTAEEDSKYTALYSTIIALISLSGNTLPDAKMDRYLRRLNLTDTTPLDNGRERTDKVMKRMERDGYIVRVKESIGAGDDDIYWTVGPRGKIEVGENGVRGLVSSVYAPAEGTEEVELERRIARSLGLGETSARTEGVGVVQSAQTGTATQNRQERGRPKRNSAEESEDDDDDDDDGDEDLV